MIAVAERATWHNPRILSTLFLVFLAGAAAGALSMGLGLHDLMHRASRPAAAEPGRDAVLQRFKTELNLTQPQTERLAAVLEDYRLYYQSLQEQLDDLRATGRTRILEILDPRQRTKFEKMMRELAPQLDGKP